MNSIILIANPMLTKLDQDATFFSNLAYVLIFAFLVFAVILWIVQYLKWRKFTQTGLSQDLAGFIKESGASDEQVMYNFVDDYFSSGYLKYDELIRFLINSLTILGLLGTFIGLSTRIVPYFDFLSDILGSTANNTVAQIGLEDIIPEITKGFRTAFMTSIIGIIAALVCSIFYNFYRQRVRAGRAEFLKIYLPGIVKSAKEGSAPYNPEDFYHEIQTYFIEGLHKFQEINISSHNKLQEWADKVITSHTTMVSTYVDSNNKKMQALIEELNKEYNALKSIAKDNLKVASILTKVVSTLDSFSDVIKNYDKTYEKLLETISEFSQNFGDLFSNITTVVDRVNQPSQLLSNLYTSIQEMVNNQNQIMGTNKLFMEETHTRFENLMQKSDANNQKTLGDIKLSLDAFISTIKETFSKQAMDELISPQTIQVIESLSTLKTELSRLSTTQSDSLTQFTKINDMVSSLSISVNTLSSVTGNMEQMSGRIDKVNRNLGKVFESLAGD